MTPLPVDVVLPDLLAALAHSPCVVLQAPTGAGKTTRVPPALLDGGLGPVVMLEPRRVAARAAARRIADERGVPLGGEVGYHVRFERKAGRDTRILVVTEGLLVRMLQDDPFLEGWGTVVLDEFHERSLHADLALAMTRRVQRDARDDLKLIVMSATLDAAPVAAFLGDCPIVTSEGRAYPVEVHYERFPDDRPIEDRVAEAVRRAGRLNGHLLAFLPGVREIHRTREGLMDMDRPVVLLYGDMPAAEQDAVLAPGGPPKIVLATNVAETSVTIPGVVGVIDSGLARVMRRDPATGLDRLELGRIAKTNATQRTGRAGRDAPGVAWRMWTEREQAAMPDRDEPEIRRVDLAGPVLELSCWGERDLAAFPWFEAPSVDALEAARRLLVDLGALTEAGVTPLGRTLARLPVHPRLGRMIVEGHRLGWASAACIAAACLSDRDPLRHREADWRSESDVIDRVDAVVQQKVDRDVARSIQRTADQLEASLKGLPAPTVRVDRDEALLRAVFAGFPDRVVRRRAGDEARGVLVGGRGVRLDKKSAVDAPLFVAVDIDAGERGRVGEGVVRVASAVDERWLPIETVITTAWDETTERVTALRQRKYRDLVLSEHPVALPNAEAAAEALARHVPLAKALPEGEDFTQLLARLRCLAVWKPELAFTPPDEAFLRDRLPELCRGRRSAEDLRRAPWTDAVLDALPWQVRGWLDADVPDKIEVPSGSRIRLTYAEGAAPVLAVRIQELFGLANTPTVASGRVRVVLHLLSPNHRPQQVTEDLASFWKNIWPEVRKELRSRYPRHSWPDDPLVAEPQSRPRRRT